jgi:hypothetical protein
VEPGEFAIEMVETRNKQNQVSTQVKVTGLMQAVLHNIDDSKESYSIGIPVMALDRGDKAHGKAISYGKKYAITACIGLLLATGEDTDSESHDVAPPQKPTAPEAKSLTDVAERNKAKRELWNAAKGYGHKTLEELDAFCTSNDMKLPKDMTVFEMSKALDLLHMQHEGAQNG